MMRNQRKMMRKQRKIMRKQRKMMRKQKKMMRKQMKILIVMKILKVLENRFLKLMKVRLRVVRKSH